MKTTISPTIRSRSAFNVRRSMFDVQCSGPLIRIPTTWLLVLAQMALPFETQIRAAANPAAQRDAAQPQPAPPKYHPETPAVSRPSATPAFSDPPTDAEIFRAHAFAEPLVPTEQTDSSENKALGVALLAFMKRGDYDEVSSLTRFLQEHPQSPWRLSLLANLGSFYRQSGYFLKALAAWEEGWQLGKNETQPQGLSLANAAVGELVELDARLGRMDRLEPLLAEIEGRTFTGPATEKVSGARHGLFLMQHHPESSFRCGPFALDRIRAWLNPADAFNPKIQGACSTTNGFSLSQVASLARDLNMEYQAAKRAPGAVVVLPAVVHWKAGHYAALVKQENGRYLAQDPTFGNDIWVSQAALDQEASGYFLIPSGPLPEGWRPVEDPEARTIWGKGQTENSDTDHTKPCDKKVPSCGQSTPMAQYAFHVMRASLNIVDTPIRYLPARGPAVAFTITYNQREANQPTTFTYSNLGNKWTCDWLAYITDDPNNGSADAAYYLRGGGTERYSGYSSGSYRNQQESRALVTRTTSTSYTRTLPDGSQEIFDLPDGSSSYPRKVFLSKILDPVGNALTFNYDSYFRLIYAVDALGQTNILAYASANPSDTTFFYKISKVTDPFGRSASFQYNGSGQLTNITDIIGITSGFTYSGDFITSLTTPYGTTSFATDETRVLSWNNLINGYLWRYTRWSQAADPLGQTERIEYHDEAPGVHQVDLQVPSGLATLDDYLNARSSFYWDKKAWHDFPGDCTKAHHFHFLHKDSNTTSGILESERPPLEGRIWMNYQGQGTTPYYEGTNGSPTKIARMLDDGSTQLYQYDYNNQGHVTKSTDPLGRTTLYTYAANGMDLAEVRQQNGAGTDLLARFTYNASHLPLTAVDAAGQTNFFGYNAYGQITAITNPLGQTTSLVYNNNSLLTNITGAIPGATTTFTYDATNRIRTVTDSEGYSVTYDYDVLDRVTKITFPDTTFEQIVYDKLDPVLSKDRRGRWTKSTYDALRRLTAVGDAAGRITQFTWCGCGGLASITDALGRTTTWLRDLEGRPTAKIYPDGSQTSYAYEIATSRLGSDTDAKNQSRVYDYNLDNSLKQISYGNCANTTTNVSFAYDTVYSRVLAMVDGTGTNTYSYYAINSPPTLGTGRLSTVDGPLSNDLIIYFYDELGRTTNRAINSTAQTACFDALSRPTVITNALGRFTNVYVGATTRLSTNFFPNGQKTVLAYYGTNADLRIQQITHSTTNGPLSAFSYTYDVDGQMQTWTQQADAANPTVWVPEYDGADQLLALAVRTNNTAGALLKQFVYGYDKAGNRLTEFIQTGSGSPAINSAAFNNLNQLTASSGGGFARFKGHLSETGSVQVAGSPAVITGNTNFTGYTQLAIGTDTVQIVATDLSTNMATNSYQIVITNSGAAETRSYDVNGNLVKVVTVYSTNTYDWDGADRLVRITQSLTNSPQLTSEFSYDGTGHRVRIVEKSNGTVQTEKTFLWCGTDLCEERDSTGASVTKRFFGQGEKVSGTNYFFTSDHLGSVREVTEVSGTIRARYDYDPFGRHTKVSGDLDVEFGFTGHYFHAASGFLLTLHRAYNPNTATWLSRDPVAESGGINLYGYVGNNPLNAIDPLGLAWFDDLASWAQCQHQQYSQAMLNMASPDNWFTVGLFNTTSELLAGALSYPQALSQLGTGSGTFAGQPTLQNAAGLFLDISLAADVLALGAAPLAHCSAGTRPRPRFVVTESGVAVPTDAAELKSNLKLLKDTSTNPAKSRKFVGEDSQGPVRVRIEQAHPETPGYTGPIDPLHTVDHLHIDRRVNGTTGKWESSEKLPYDWPFD